MGGGLCAARGSENSSASFRTTRTPNPQVPSYGLTTSGPTFSSGVNRSGWETTYVAGIGAPAAPRSEEHTSELQSRGHLVCRLLLEKKKRHQARPRAPNRYMANGCVAVRYLAYSTGA